jgi:hypothetical protein
MQDSERAVSWWDSVLGSEEFKWREQKQQFLADPDCPLRTDLTAIQFQRLNAAAQLTLGVGSDSSADIQKGRQRWAALFPDFPCPAPSAELRGLIYPEHQPSLAVGWMHALEALMTEVDIMPEPPAGWVDAPTAGAYLARHLEGIKDLFCDALHFVGRRDSRGRVGYVDFLASVLGCANYYVTPACRLKTVFSSRRAGSENTKSKKRECLESLEDSAERLAGLYVVLREFCKMERLPLALGVALVTLSGRLLSDASDNLWRYQFPGNKGGRPKKLDAAGERRLYEEFRQKRAATPTTREAFNGLSALDIAEDLGREYGISAATVVRAKAKGRAAHPVSLEKALGPYIGSEEDRRRAALLQEAYPLPGMIYIA